MFISISRFSSQSQNYSCWSDKDILPLICLASDTDCILRQIDRKIEFITVEQTTKASFNEAT